MVRILTGIQLTKRDTYFFIKGVIKAESPLLCTRTILRMTKRAYQAMKKVEKDTENCVNC